MSLVVYLETPQTPGEGQGFFHLTHLVVRVVLTHQTTFQWYLMINLII
jgi:hypothetical protein